jgi:hypothetical protein
VNLGTTLIIGNIIGNNDKHKCGKQKMNNFSEKFLVDANGKQIAVLLDIVYYQKILEELEELEAIRA